MLSSSRSASIDLTEPATGGGQGVCFGTPGGTRRVSDLDDDTPMAFDVADRSWLGLLETDGLIDYEDVALAVLPKVLRVAEHSREHLGMVRHFAEELLLEPGVCEEARQHFSGFRHVLAWRTLASVLREPARSRCLDLARIRPDRSSPAEAQSA